MENRRPDRYSHFQITLHLAVVALIAMQFLVAEGMEDAWDAVEDGLQAEPGTMAIAHIAGGLAVLVLTLLRLALRARRGAPPLPDGDPAILKLAAHAAHAGLYGLLVLVPLSGAAAWFSGGEAAADAHEALKTLLLLLVALHVCGALFQQFILGTAILSRMWWTDRQGR